MKICTVISSHSPSVFTKLTVASLLREMRSKFDLNIHIGVHENYSDYTTDLSLFDETRSIAHIHLVPEIDWIAHNENVYRYSLMHAKNLENLLKQVKYYDFDHLLILDNDLYIQKDFLTPLLERYPDSDLIGHYFADKREPSSVNESMAGERIQMMPKCSVWCTVLSRRMYDNIMKDTTVLYPEKIYDTSMIEQSVERFPGSESVPLVFDTFSKVTFKAIDDWGMKVEMLPEAEMMDGIMHFSGSSFNYGSRNHSVEPGRLRATEIYEREFPDGLEK